MLKLLLLTTAWAQMTINRVPIGNARPRSNAGSLVLEVHQGCLRTGQQRRVRIAPGADHPNAAAAFFEAAVRIPRLSPAGARVLNHRLIPVATSSIIHSPGRKIT